MSTHSEDDKAEAGSARSRSGWLDRLGSLLLLVLIGSLLLLWPAFAAFYTDWLWYEDLGYSAVFVTRLTVQGTVGLTVAIAAVAGLWLTFRLALRLSPARPFARLTTKDGQQIQVPDLGHLVEYLPLAGSLIIGGLLGLQASSMWEVFLRYRYQVPFGQSDPIFGSDIGFYVFTLPVLDFVSNLLMTALVACLAGSIVIFMGRTFDPMAPPKFPPEFAPRQRVLLLALVAAMGLTLAFRSYLAMPALLYSRAGPVAGASYTDIAARLPLLNLEAAAAVFTALLALVAATRRRNVLVWVGIFIYGLTILAGVLYPLALQRFVVLPNELAREAPYIEYNIAATQKAFGLDRIEEKELEGDTALTPDDIARNRRTIENIRLWDQQPLLDTFAQIQEIRTYYEFQSVDNDRYRIDGEMRQVMLSPRDLASASLPNRNWINEHLTFTHGFGLTLGPVNQVTAEGLPVLFIKDLPPVSTIPALRIDRPEIYFGELSNDRVYVNTRTEEFNYPAGDENVSAKYAGARGVSLSSFWHQLLFSTRFADLKLLLSDDLRSESRVLYHRNPRERLGRVAPFLRFDSDPYMVISEGGLFWIADAYTVSDRYPYSQPLPSGINYIRNSVKAVVNAYDGEVRLYIADNTDPIIRTYMGIFPEMFRPLEELSADLRSHLRYPEDIFKIQATVYSTYHMDQPQVFYNKEDQWTAASVTGARGEGAAPAMEPYYTIMRLPDEESEEFILMLPFTPARKDNLAAWITARSDGENYGKLLVYQFPKQKLVFGPMQIVARVNQDPEISRQLSLWNQRGSQVIFGNLMVIPIERSLIYVQALYLRAESGRIPELRRVIVAAENRIAMEPTLEASIAAIFGAAAPRPPSTEITSTAAPTGGTGAEVQRLIEQARQHYDLAIQAQRSGDWARYGEEIRLLGSVLEQIKQ